MTLNHINLTVTDAEESANFLIKYFGLKTMEGVPMSKTFVLLRDDAGMALTLMRGKRDTVPSYPPTFHIGFAQPSEDAVNEVNRRLKEDGYDVQEPARLHGSWTFYLRAPGGFDVEVLA